MQRISLRILSGDFCKNSFWVFPGDSGILPGEFFRNSVRGFFQELHLWFTPGMPSRDSYKNSCWEFFLEFLHKLLLGIPLGTPCPKHYIRGNILWNFCCGFLLFWKISLWSDFFRHCFMRIPPRILSEETLSENSSENLLWGFIQEFRQRILSGITSVDYSRNVIWGLLQEFLPEFIQKLLWTHYDYCFAMVEF